MSEQLTKGDNMNDCKHMSKTCKDLKYAVKRMEITRLNDEKNLLSSRTDVNLWKCNSCHHYLLYDYSEYTDVGKHLSSV